MEDLGGGNHSKDVVVHPRHVHDLFVQLNVLELSLIVEVVDLNYRTNAIWVRSSHADDVGLSRVVQTVLSLLSFSVHSEIVVNLDLGELVLALSILVINADGSIGLEADWAGLKVLGFNTKINKITNWLEAHENCVDLHCEN